MTRQFDFLIWTLLLATTAQAEEGFKLKHPLPDYSVYSDFEITTMANRIRESRPQIQRGGWEWDRLLRRYIDEGRREAGAIKVLQGYFMSILDRYDEAVRNGTGDEYNLLPGHKAWGAAGRVRVYEELARQGMLSDIEKAKFYQIFRQSMVLSYDYPMLERSVNNRPYGMNAGPAVALKVFPDMPELKTHRRWLDALWRELTEYGDTTETNYYPYGPLLLQGWIDMAEGMDKFKTDRNLLYALAKRYLDHVHGGGVRGNPNSGGKIKPGRDHIYLDPWNAEYYGGAEGVNDGDVWYRLAKEYRDPEFLWASEQAVFGGRPPLGQALSTEYEDAYRERYQWFIERGIKPRAPSGQSKIGYYSPLKHRVPERLYLCPSRESGKPFVSFYLYDRNNNYMHCCDDAAGRLYEYCVDGAKFLHSSGKYNNRFWGQAAYDLLNVLPPDMAFPFREEDGKMGGEREDTWKLASLSLPFSLNCRTAPDSKNWFYDESIKLFRRTDDPEFGYAHGNVDGYWYLNNDFHLRSVYLGKFDRLTRLQNLRLAGPKGSITLAALDRIPEQLKLIEHLGEEQFELTGAERAVAMSIVKDGRTGGHSLQLNVQPGTSLSVVLNGLDLKFDANDEYTRVSYDYCGRTTGMFLNEYTRPIYHRPQYNRGGILVRESLRAENHGEDSFGQFTYRNYFGADSVWTRQTVITEEGYLVVRDEYLPGPDVDGFQAAPNWMLNDGGGSPDSKRHWYDAPAMSHAWWQTQPKRVLLYMHPDRRLEFGQVAHGASQDLGYGRLRSSFGKAILREGKKQVWLAVLLPFNEGADPRTVAALIQTKLTRNGQALASVGRVTVNIKPDGRWAAVRQ
ncbi:MAG: hypothetical protein QGG00_01900 [Verrucomicrobiota bacterium]|jgi:hypothetical protein|nr:hypothetical protein [Verrucomicrobiota bacterium]